MPNLNERELERDKGMGQAVDHANMEHLAWSDRALAFVHMYALEHQEFTCELVRNYAESRGMPKPPSERAWGHPMRAAAKNRWIEKTERRMVAIDPRVHCNELKVWRSLIWREHG